jgi:hypothetical protein
LAATYAQAPPLNDDDLGDSFVVPRTLVVGADDDFSVVSQITLDMRFNEDDALSMPPVSGRRPGPETGASHSDLQRPMRGVPSFRGRRQPTPPQQQQQPFHPPGGVIREEEEYEAVNLSTTPLGLDPSSNVPGVGKGWDTKDDIDRLLSGNLNSAPPSRNNSADDAVFQQHDIVLETPDLDHHPSRPPTITNNTINPNLRREFTIVPPPARATEDRPSVLLVENLKVERLPGSSEVNVASPVLRPAQDHPGKFNGRESRATFTSGSFAPPLRDIHGRADSGHNLDPMANGTATLQNDKRSTQPLGSGIVTKDATHQTDKEERRQSRKDKRGKKNEGDKQSSTVTIETSASPVARERPNEAKVPDDDPISAGKTPTEKKAKKKKQAAKASEHAGSKQPRTARKNEKKKMKQQKQDMHDIPTIMHCLSLDECNSHMREKALDSLAAILWRSSSKGKEFVLQYKGVETVTKSMWADMESQEVQSSAMHLVLAMAASPDGIAENDMLSNEDSICDTILFTMQNHWSVPVIQLRGCLIFACLAGASHDNKAISDGSLSGSILMVLTAMNNHQNDCSILKAGLQALHNQCCLSVHAEANKRTLMGSKLDDGSLGLEVILRSMEKLQEDCIAMEWACRICWCLTSSEDLVKSSAEIPLHEAIVPICERHIDNTCTRGLVEAAMGTIGNLAHVEKTHEDLGNVGAIEMILDGLSTYGTDYGISFEAIAAIANLATSPSARDSFVKSGAVGLVIHSLRHFFDFSEYAGEALRALASLAANSKDSGEILISEDVLKIIRDTSQHHQTLLVQHMCAALMGAFAVHPSVCDLLVTHDAVPTVLSAMEKFPDLKLQEAGCNALRNLFSQVLLTDKILEDGETESAIIDAMETHKDSASIQEDACCTLWNMVYKSEEPAKVVSLHAVKCIVRAMQTHMESGSVLEQACGALWTLVDGSMEMKKDVVANGAIDAVTCAIAVHPTNSETLEMACGVLSNVSAEATLAKAIADAQGVSIVVEAMRNNINSVSLLEVGCLMMRNVIFLFPGVTQEASPVIATVVNAMQDNVDAVDFQKEACNLLWILSAEEESCQSKVLALDGLSILMKVMEENKDDSELQRSALGAFNQLSFAGHREEGSAS